MCFIAQAFVVKKTSHDLNGTIMLQTGCNAPATNASARALPVEYDGETSEEDCMSVSSDGMLGPNFECKVSNTSKFGAYSVEVSSALKSRRS